MGSYAARPAPPVRLVMITCSPRSAACAPFHHERVRSCSWPHPAREYGSGSNTTPVTRRADDASTTSRTGPGSTKSGDSGTSPRRVYLAQVVAAVDVVALGRVDEGARQEAEGEQHDRTDHHRDRGEAEREREGSDAAGGDADSGASRRAGQPGRRRSVEVDGDASRWRATIASSTSSTCGGSDSSAA
jgi:hypothetical protein